MGFGKLLDQKIQEKNITQAELAAAVGIPKTTLSSIISRDSTKIAIEIFLKMCDYLECDPEEFYREFRNNEFEQKSQNVNCDLLSECHSSEAYNAVKLFLMLDTFDRGRIVGNMEEMLKEEKYLKRSQNSEKAAI